MKQVVQSLKTGIVEVLDVPTPQRSSRCVSINTSLSLISAGTERMMIDFGRGNWIQKARQQPDKVRMVLNKIRTDGLAATLQAVNTKLDQPLAPGYCNVGVVEYCGAGVSGISVGDRIVSNGKHAEHVVVPGNLCARIPEGVSDEDAAFTVVGAIGLQGIRLAQVSLGETVAVIGLGLIGLLTVQLLRAQGCRVIGIDFDVQKLSLAEKFGASTIHLDDGVDPVQAAVQFSRGRGVDAVLITAATDSNDPVRQAAQMCRKRGRIVLVGVAGLNLSRADFYEKELSFQVSCSYGPGRYDPTYEEGGVDYPIGYVRWTEQRNFEAVLDMMAAGAIDCESLRTHEFDVEAAAAAYDVIAGAAPSLGVILRYHCGNSASAPAQSIAMPRPAETDIRSAAHKVVLNAIGAGNYASAVLLPAFSRTEAIFRCIASGSGLSAAHLARKFGFEVASTDTAALIADPDANAVVITTRHNSHASLVLEALAAGKHIFVEKPLALSEAEIAQIETRYQALDRPPHLMIGFNRRFAPLAVDAKRRIGLSAAPVSMIYIVNAGAIPQDHWTQDPDIGGGRIVGECCHFIDLLRFFAGAPILSHDIISMREGVRDTVTINLNFANGSIGTIHYFCNGHPSFPKERIQIFQAGHVIEIDNFRWSSGFGSGKLSGARRFRQDKGQIGCANAFVEAISKGGASPIPFGEIIEVSRVSMELANMIRSTG
jgi:predicted dehydrogenase